MNGDNGLENYRQIGLRFDLVEFCRLDQRSDDAPVLSSGVMTGEECIFSIKSDGADCPFDGVVVHLDPTVAEKQDYPVPKSGGIAQGFT